MNDDLFIKTEPGWAIIGIEENQAYIFDFYIQPEYRNRGIGTRLFKLVLKRLKKLGIKEVSLEVNNEAMEAIVKKFGGTFETETDLGRQYILEVR